MSDRETVIRALRSASDILLEYLEPGPQNAEETITRLLVVLDSQELALALIRLDEEESSLRDVACKFDHDRN